MTPSSPFPKVFSVLHASLMEDQGRRVVAFYQFCLSGGHLNFLQRPAIRKHWGVDNWPIYMIASSGLRSELGGRFGYFYFLSVRGRGNGRKRPSRWAGAGGFCTENKGREGGGYPRRRGNRWEEGGGINIFLFGAEMPAKRRRETTPTSKISALPRTQPL